MNYPRIILKKGRDVALRHGHPWLFSGAIATVEGKPAPGDIVLAADVTGRPPSLWDFSTAGDIAFRLLTDDPAVTDRCRFLAAADRKGPCPAPSGRPAGYGCFPPDQRGRGRHARSCLRLLWPLDLVITIGTAGMEKWRETVIGLLLEILAPVGIYERSEGRSRQLEGLSDRIGLAAGEIPETVEITENGLRFEVDLITGQKTGFFLDQRPNRESVGAFSREAAVLNCFSYTGAFSVYAARGGAKRVVSVEASAAPMRSPAGTSSGTAFPRSNTRCSPANVFDYLRETEEIFDLIILDPPAFAKSRKDVDRSARGYKEINLQAARRLREGGFLATFSCSNPIDPELFEKIVLGAVRDAGKTAQLLRLLGAGPDHPVNLAHPEGRYLKGLLLCLHSG